jgi:hypothetical protein
MRPDRPSRSELLERREDGQADNDMSTMPMMGLGERIGIDESEWRDDPAGLAEWETWLRTIPENGRL